MLSFIPCVTKPCGYSLLLGKVHSFVGCHQKFKAYLKSYLNLALQWIRCIWLWTQEWEAVCYIEY